MTSRRPHRRALGNGDLASDLRYIKAAAYTPHSPGPLNGRSISSASVVPKKEPPDEPPEQLMPSDLFVDAGEHRPADAAGPRRPKNRHADYDSDSDDAIYDAPYGIPYDTEYESIPTSPMGSSLGHPMGSPVGSPMAFTVARPKRLQPSRFLCSDDTFSDDGDCD